MSHLFLTGFMGAGKSTVGRLVAGRLGRQFVDLDAEIELREGVTVQDLFRSRGEAGFRDAEHAALADLVACSPAVIATGGGVVLREDNQVLLRGHGTVVYLAVTPEEAMARLGGADDRPLLAAGGLTAARSVLGARLGLYAATADHVVQTVGLGPSEVADVVVSAVSRSGCVRVGGSAGYDIVFGRGVLSTAGERVREVVGPGSVALVSDENVWRLCGPALAESLRGAGLAVTEYTIPAGESSKSWVMAGSLLERMAASGHDRGSTVVGLGGGVVGDLAGFCAATFMRGISLVHVPTTLLAQVDSAIGGKTAVDLAAGKNLAGAFWPPGLVLVDPTLLDSLPPAEWTNGLVEAAKAALLAGGGQLAAFESSLPGIMAGDEAAIDAMVHDAAAFKAGVVTSDLRETDLRECLNLGHTLGHALEVLTGYGTVPHGLAVAEGMRFAAALACELALASPSLTDRTEAILAAVGAGAPACRTLFAQFRDRLSPDELLSAMKSDKKSRGGIVRFVLLEAPGRWSVHPVADEMLRAALGTWTAGLSSGGA